MEVISIKPKHSKKYTQNQIVHLIEDFVNNPNYKYLFIKTL